MRPGGQPHPEGVNNPYAAPVPQDAPEMPYTNTPYGGVAPEGVSPTGMPQWSPWNANVAPMQQMPPVAPTHAVPPLYAPQQVPPQEMPSYAQPGFQPGVYPEVWPNVQPGFPPAPYPPYGYWPIPADSRVEKVSKQPWPAPGHSRLHKTDNPRPRRWWTPLLSFLAGSAAWFIVVIVASVFLGIYAAASGLGMDFILDIAESDLNVMTNPLFYIITFGVLALMLPFVWLGLRLVEGVSIGALSSVTGYLRWNRIWGGLGLAIVALSPSIILSTVEAARMGGPTPEAISRLPLLLPIIFVLVPLQCAAEEYVFRGFFLRTLMGWGLNSIIAIIIATIFFTLGHVYGWMGMVDVAVFGLAMGWLTVRTKGLEASIALHVVNNMSGMLFAALGLANPLDDSEMPLWTLFFSIGLTIVYTVVADRLWAERSTDAPVQQPPSDTAEPTTPFAPSAPTPTGIPPQTPEVPGVAQDQNH